MMPRAPNAAPFGSGDLFATRGSQAAYPRHRSAAESAEVIAIAALS